MEQPQELFNFLEHSGKDPFHLIFEDELTGIYNRRFLYQYLQSKVEWNALENRPFSLLMMDVDNFKRINDSYGHQIGDQALIWVTDLIKEVAGEEGFTYILDISNNGCLGTSTDTHDCYNCPYSDYNPEHSQESP